jgi:uridylate kinase
VENTNAEIIVLSLGGSLVVPNGGIDADFLKKFNQFIRKQVKNGRRFIIVVGGGKTTRHYQNAGKSVIGKITEEDLDWLGIHSTRMNAHLLRTVFQDIAHPRIIENYDKKLTNWKEPVVIGAGWKPGWSTDHDAVIVARDYKASVIINLSNVDWVYNKDPAKFKDAQPIKKITWDHFESLVGNKWIPGINAPFDPIATQLAKKIGLTVIITNGKNFNNLENILSGKSFKGTIITPFKIDASFYDREYYEKKKGEYPLSYTESFLGNLIQDIVNFYRALSIKIFINPKSSLDVGCGTGKLVHCLRNLGIEAYGIEISKYALETATKETRSFLKYGDIIKIPYDDNSFDLVLTFDVLEHIERPKLKKAIEETIRVSKKWILHKIYTTENHWIALFHGKDFSHLSVLSASFWVNMFKTMKNITVVRKVFIKLPSFFETKFLLKKK